MAKLIFDYIFYRLKHEAAAASLALCYNRQPHMVHMWLAVLPVGNRVVERASGMKLKDLTTLR